jgi:hypothetical protein
MTRWPARRVLSREARGQAFSVGVSVRVAVSWSCLLRPPNRTQARHTVPLAQLNASLHRSEVSLLDRFDGLNRKGRWPSEI